MTAKFTKLAANESHPGWKKLIERRTPLYAREGDMRSAFERDYTRILHSMAYRRLKHKTQVFFNINNDHICTRMEHVSHVESVSSMIARVLGLNEELTKAISIGHDLGHAPFGHQGELVIRKLTKEHLGRNFWHEQNGLRFVDRLELLEDPYKIHRNLNLSYAVRDGILSHCGEVDQNGIFPRDISIPIEDFDEAGKYQAVTWEGCVVKIADKIAYVGRDIEDAISLGFLDQSAQDELLKMAQVNSRQGINTTVIIHNMIMDICKNSSPDRGIAMSPQVNQQLAEIKAFNYKYIYRHERLLPFQHYAELIITQIFDTLLSFYNGQSIWKNLDDFRRFAPKMVREFESFLARYCHPDIIPEGRLGKLASRCENEKIYGYLESREIYIQAVIDYISGMTDRFAIDLFQELLEYDSV